MPARDKSTLENTALDTGYNIVHIRRGIVGVVLPPPLAGRPSPDEGSQAILRWETAYYATAKRLFEGTSRKAITWMKEHPRNGIAIEVLRLRIQSLAQRLAHSWGLPYGDADTSSAYIDVIREGDTFTVRSCGYLPQITGSAEEVDAKLSLVVDAVAATLAVIRAGKHDVVSNGVNGYLILVKGKPGALRV